ncbi:MAG: metalloregulator ArsR/SmtB family transcription factor [Alphaproteobacteria bacterium]|nr:metalloregulator ArsR/SmtB family transcription factor [Alphaproteobacteria bacterium]
MHSDPLSATFTALAHPARRAILARLARGPAAVMDLGRPLGLSPQAVSKHLKVLEGAGLIARTRLAQWRPAALVPEALAEAAQWLEDTRRARQDRPAARRNEPSAR